MSCLARISKVEEDSPAYKAGLRAGCSIKEVEGCPLRDAIDWQWLSSEDEVEVSYVDEKGSPHEISMSRRPGELWGVCYEGAVFDGVKTCRNSCKFCFMRQLPQGMRPSLALRDDDYRLSFIDGTFVTLTNLSKADVDRIIEQRISPLRVSLHATSPDVRRRLIGRHADAGLDNLETLLKAGIEFDAQIVLVPGENDGEELDRTLEWAYSYEGVQAVGVVPLGFTRFQDVFERSFDGPEDALEVIRQLEPFQRRAMSERGHPWVFAADEFYVNAFGEDVLERLPGEDFYDGYPMFEDGIGIVRSTISEFEEASANGLAYRCAEALTKAGWRAAYICGKALEPYADTLFERAGLSDVLKALPVENCYFGGNVDVTGLLSARDIVNAIKSSDFDRHFIPRAVFNSDGVTLDDMGLEDIRSMLPADKGRGVHAVASNPIDYIQEIEELAQASLDR